MNPGDMPLDPTLKGAGSGEKQPEEKNVPESAKTESNKKTSTIFSSRFLTPPSKFNPMPSSPEPGCSTSHSTPSGSKEKIPPDPISKASGSGGKQPEEGTGPGSAEAENKRKDIYLSNTRTPIRLLDPLPSFDEMLKLWIPESECSTSSSSPSGSKEEEVCAFYRTSIGPNGETVFNKALLKYFLKCDSPGMDDLKNKRFNTSFLRYPKTNKDNLKIFTEEEDNDPKYFEDIPGVREFPKLRKKSVEFPEVPGTMYEKVFENIPIDAFDEDEEAFSKEEKSVTKMRKGCQRTKKSVKKGRIGFKRSRKSFVLPDESIGFDYGNLFNSPAKFNSNEGCANNDGLLVFGDFFKNKSKFGLNANGAKNDNKEIDETSEESSSSLLNSLSDSGDSSSIVNSISDLFDNDSNISNSLPDSVDTDPSPKPPNLNLLPCYKFLSRMEKDETILNKYKDILGNRKCVVTLRKVHYDPKLVAKSSYDDDKSHAKRNKKK